MGGEAVTGQVNRHISALCGEEECGEEKKQKKKTAQHNTQLYYSYTTMSHFNLLDERLIDRIVLQTL